jgi:hypothetical protein
VIWLALAWDWAKQLLRALPWQVWAVAGLCVLVAGLRWHWIGVGVERCQSAQEAAETKADAKAAKVAGRAHAKAQEASAIIQKETDHAAAEVRVILRDRVCPLVPERVHELGEQAVERAQQALRPAEG